MDFVNSDFGVWLKSNKISSILHEDLIAFHTVCSDTHSATINRIHFFVSIATLNILCHYMILFYYYILLYYNILTMGAGSFPGVMWSGFGLDHPPHLAPRLKKG